MANTPLARVQKEFGEKKKLVEAIEKLATEALWLDRVNADKGLARISNAKLLRLHASLEDAKKRFGSREALINKIVELEKRTKDEGFKLRLQKFPLPRLIDLHDSAEKRVAREAKKAESAKK